MHATWHVPGHLIVLGGNAAGRACMHEPLDSKSATARACCLHLRGPSSAVMKGTIVVVAGSNSMRCRSSCRIVMVRDEFEAAAARAIDGIGQDSRDGLSNRAAGWDIYKSPKSTSRCRNSSYSSRPSPSPPSRKHLVD
jgi:hypothetical protein